MAGQNEKERMTNRRSACTASTIFMKANLKNMTIKEMETFFETIGEKKFRAKQVFSWLYKGVYDFAEMTDLSKELREKMEESAFIEKLEIIDLQISQKDGTRKYLFRLTDGNTVESVYLKYKYGNSVCLSSQAGCRMGCTFCASAIGGLQRNLSASEMIDQILTIEKDVEERVSHFVVMGTGEPFDNYDNLIRFITLANAKEGLNIGSRNITVSTCGLIPGIRDFAKDMPQVNLAISLHASNDRVRERLMPISKRYPMTELLEAAKWHAEKTGRRVTYEYALIKDVNDSDKHMKELASKLRGSLCHVNLISLNQVTESEFKGSGRVVAEQFKAGLEAAGIQTTIRREMGDDIDAACGQLRAGR
jgi:23S rRNA (adenine2503-C2)-methyltransferase